MKSLFMTAALCAATFEIATAAPPFDTEKIDQITGLKGDFAVTEDELQSALKAIRAGGINIVAIHSHMTHEQPRILFFHYWGRGPSKKMAEAIQGAILACGLSGVSTSVAK